MGAVPGPGLLTGSPSGPGSTPAVPTWLDVEPYRELVGRTVVVRSLAGGPVLTLGSRQDPAVIDRTEAQRLGVAVVRRRTAGGAVLLQTGLSVWADVWIPSRDPLARTDVLAASAWVGAWWRDALGSLGAPPLQVHVGRQVCGAWGSVVCFAGLGAGEVTAAGRKVVGVTQWRCRQGALFQTMAYLRWEPAPLVALLALPAAERDGAAAALGGAAVGVQSLAGVPVATGDVEEALLAHLPGGPDWDVRRSPAGGGRPG